MTDEIAKSLGFENAAEFFKLTSEADISSAEAFAKFKQWQEADGSKNGLLALSS